LLLKFIEKVGKKSEITLFWKVFQGLPRMKFAVISLSHDVLKHQLQSVAENLALMNKLDIYPILVLNLPDQPNLTILKRQFTLLSRKLIKEIRRNKGHVQVVNDAYFWTDQPRSQLKINASKILSAMSRSQMPIIHLSGEKKGQKIMMDGDILAKALVKHIKPKKYMMITSEGGILDIHGQIIPFLNVSHKGEWVSSVRKDFKKKVRDLKDFVKSQPSTALVVTSPDQLLREIFTVKGQGTFIKHHILESETDLANVNKKKIKALLENAFDKTLVDGYFNEPIQTVIYQKDYEGVAIIQDINGLPYLDKFAVAKIYEGTGLGKSLWQKMSRKYTKLAWRATPSNSLNKFYMRECDGCLKFPDWIVYWKGLDESEIFPTAQLILKKKPTLIPFDADA
jgi:acetylglutamate synthase